MEEVRRAGESSTGLRIKAGLEVDYFPGSKPLLRDISESHDLDFTMMGIHWIVNSVWTVLSIGGLSRWLLKEDGFDKFYAKYLGLFEKAVESGLFNVIAHFDVVRNWGVQTL